MRTRSWRLAAACLSCVLLSPDTSGAGAQVTVGTLTGSVVDPSGAPIPGAAVVAVDALRASARTTVSDERGRYRFADLAPALYNVSAAARGFDRVERLNVQVEVDGRLHLDFHLPIAGIVQSVDVTARLDPIRPGATDLGAVIDQHVIQSLPLNRRDFLQLAMLTPGVNAPSQGSELSSRGSFAMHANGGREEYNNFLLDGADNNDAYVNRYVVQPPVDTIQEFKIATSSYDAEYGRGAAGQVNVITKSGSNRLELTAYEYFRNGALNARNAFDTEGEEAPFERSQFGVSVGGPLLRSRVFAFANLDFLRQRSSVTRLSTVPTDLQRAGNLSELAATVSDPFTRQPFAGNVIPAGRIDPAANKVLEMYPHANRPGLSGNHESDAPYREDQHQATLRLDHWLPGGHHLMGRYNRGRVRAFEPYAEDAGSVPGFGNTYEDPANNATLQYQRMLGSRTTGVTRIAHNSYRRDILPENHGTDVGALWGVSWLAVPERDRGYPAVSVAGYSKAGDTGTLPIQRVSATYQLAQTFTLARGAHLWQFGGEIRHHRLDGHLDILARGSLTFSGALSGAGIGDLLLGYPSFTLQSTSDNALQLRTTGYSAYAQDEWRVGRGATVNFGVRYEYYTPARDPAGRMSAFNPGTGTVAPVGTNGMSEAGISPDTNNIAPRVGIAWQPGPGTVIRAGYGLYYDAGMFEVNSAMYFNPPQFTLRAWFPTQYSLLTLGNPFPSGGGITPPASITSLNPGLVSASMQHWNATVQRDLGPVGILTASYAGSKGRHLIRSRDLNQPPPGPGDVQARRPHPAYGSIFYIESAGRSTFRSLQLGLNRPLAGGVAARAAYTLSDSKDDGSAFLGTDGDANFPQDSRNMAAQWGPSGFDVRHRFAATAVWQLPGSHAVTRGMELRAIVTVRSGQPFTPLLRFDNSNTGNTGQQSGSDRPNLVGDPAIANPSAHRWFETGAFAVPPRYTFGDAGRNCLRGPGYSSVDLAIARRIRLGGRGTMWLEAQAFNVFNRVNYDLPELYVDEPATFGRIFSARSARQVQLAVRVVF